MNDIKDVALMLEKKVNSQYAEISALKKQLVELSAVNALWEKKLIEEQEEHGSLKARLTAEKARGERLLASFKKFLYRGENANDSLEFAYRAEAEKAIKEYRRENDNHS